jgi:hypothetical protein
MFNDALVEEFLETKLEKELVPGNPITHSQTCKSMNCT